jgi:hypothetical protein
MSYGRPSPSLAWASFEGLAAYTRPDFDDADAQWVEPADIQGRVAAPGPLAVAQLVAFAPPAGQLQAPGVLRAALILGRQPPFAFLAAASPLRLSFRARAVSDFTVAVADLPPQYVMDLVTPGGSVRVPISNWQATLRTGAQNFLQCNVPGCAPYLESLNLATAFIIRRRVVLPSGTAIEYEMANADISSLSLAQGPRNYTATLTGFSTGFAQEEDTSPALERQLREVRQTNVSGSGLRVRCDVDWLLRPGMTARLNNVPFVVGRISYFVSSAEAYMDVSETQ